MSNALRKSISSSFNMSGYYLRSEAVDYLVKQFENIDDRDKREAWIEKICDHIGRQNKVQPFLEFEDIKSAVDACCKHVQESSQPLVEVISAFDVPKFNFHIDLKKFFPTRSETHPLLAPPETCTKFYTERFLMLKQRTLRHHLFKSGQQFQVQPIEVLLSSSHKIKHVVILGMLTTMKDGRYQLEDPTGSIPINLTGVKYHTGFFTDNCFVLAEGNYKDEIFHVDSIGFPPTETAEMSRAVFGGGNIFGGLPETSLHNYESLKALESSNPDSMIIFLSEVWLDRKEVMERLNRLFEGYADVPPAVIVLMGNFLSTDMGPKHSLILKSHFKELANMIGNYESLVKSTKFVFVPGPTDSFLGNILPRPPISKTVTEYFLKKVPNSIFTTSPCRLRYCTQEIVLMREDIIIRLCRNSLHAPDISDIPQHFVKTIVSQAYLMPLPVTLSPVYWAHETALRLYPLPDLIVMADSFQPYTAKNTGCIVTNPSSFSNGNYAFKVYIPSSREVEDSQIPEET